MCTDIGLKAKLLCLARSSGVKLAELEEFYYKGTLPKVQLRHLEHHLEQEKLKRKQPHNV